MCSRWGVEPCQPRFGSFIKEINKTTAKLGFGPKSEVGSKLRPTPLAQFAAQSVSVDSPGTIPL